VQIIDELNRQAIATEDEIIDKVCAELSAGAAALVLELADGMITAGWDESGGVARARRRLLERQANHAGTHKHD